MNKNHPTLQPITGSHYHCKSCGAVMQFVLGFTWNVKTGVRRLAVCKACLMSMLESEYGPSKWTQL